MKDELLELGKMALWLAALAFWVAVACFVILIADWPPGLAASIRNLG